MSDSTSVIKFRISGAQMDDKAASEFVIDVLGDRAEGIQAYNLYTHRSGERPAVAEAKSGLDVVILKIASGPALVLHPENARDLLLSGNVVLRSTEADSVPVTANLPWTEEMGAERGLGESLLRPVLQWFGVVRLDPLEIAAQGSALMLANWIDNEVREGLYQLQRDSYPDKLAQSRQSTERLADDYAGEPLLVLVHGTFVNTAKTFGKLWTEHPDIVKKLFDQYDGQVFGFEHATIGRSPIDNAQALADALPENAVVDFLTHSRGGLIAEILVAAGSAVTGPDDLKRSFDFNAKEAEALARLSDTLRDKNVSIKRVVRVACPARGTLLASSRLDAYLSVIQWLMRAAGLQVSPVLMKFAREVARQRLEPAVLPGLAAMVPEKNPLLKWLNSLMKRAAGGLYVIAGDSSGDSVTAWIKTLVADAFFWTDNDQVVQTQSMYGGVPREEGTGARFCLFEGGRVSHFSYFSYDKSVDAIADAFLQNPQKEWRPIGPLSWRGEDASGVRARREKGVSKPRVLVLPDFFGSHLDTENGERVWLGATSLTGFERLDSSIKLVPTELVAERYGKLCARLEETHEVIPFPYDWRRSIEIESTRLAERIERELNGTAGPVYPVRIVAHGMGGLLVRALHMNHPETWTKMMAVEGARVVMLGTPNAGAWTPIQVLSGDESFGNVLSSAGPLFSDTAIRETLAGMPGFIQLQAGLLDPRTKLGFSDGWAELEGIQQKATDGATKWHVKTGKWMIPSQPLLTGATLFWRKLEQSLPSLARDMDKIALTIGTAHSTPCDLTELNGQLCFRTVEQGDGRVTLDSTRMHNAPVWCIEAEHGELPRAVASFGGLLDLLVDGTTAQLKKVEARASAEREAATLSHANRIRARHFGETCRARPPGEIGDLFHVVQNEGLELPLAERLTVRVYHGDLRFVREPLLVGHYQSLSLTGSEAVVNTLVGLRMSKAVRAGIYPERVGSYQIFQNGRQDNFGRQRRRLIPRPRAAIVVGLGEEGKLSAQQLSFTIRTGIIAYAERLSENLTAEQGFECAATLIGSGGTGITVANAALSLVQAITDANMKLQEAKWPRVRALKIVELFLDRATDAWRVLRLHAEANPERLAVEGFLIEGNGNLRRTLDSSYRGATYDFITARQTVGTQRRQPVITYSLDTKRARTEVRAQRAQGALLRDLVAKASNSSRIDPLIGRTLFNLLVPVEIEPYLAGSSDMVMELDLQTSALPWELLDTEPAVRTDLTLGAPVPWAIRCKVIRKLQVEQYRTQVADATLDQNILIIGEPLVDAAYGRLPGARREAEAIFKVARSVLGGNNERVTLLAKQNDAHTIINQLFARKYRMIHIAGHGTGGHAGGVVLSGAQTFLGPNEIRAMRVTPELVFVNCCYLAQRDNGPPYDRVEFAASVADALINIGVRCVVAAGWAVEDGPAEKFATAFYAELFAGARFIDAVGEARRAAWEANPDGNTWAAYQCYGDPDWSWRDDATAAPPAPEEEYAGVTSPTVLVLVLQTIATQALYDTDANLARQRARLEHLKDKFKDWTGRGDVAQEFGNAYAALSDRNQAITWFGAARKAMDGRATFQAVELYAEQLSLPGASKDELKEAIRVLATLNTKLASTFRRHSLLGIALKRLSVVIKHPRILRWAIYHFEKAAGYKDERYNFYPRRAMLECNLRQHLIQSGELLPANWCDGQIAEVDRLIDKAAHDEPDFWSIVAQSQLDLIKAILRCRLQRLLPEIKPSLEDLHTRIITRRFWTYVYDDASFILQPYREFAAAHKENAELTAVDELLKFLAKYSGL